MQIIFSFYKFGVNQFTPESTLNAILIAANKLRIPQTETNIDKNMIHFAIVRIYNTNTSAHTRRAESISYVLLLLIRAMINNVKRFLWRRHVSLILCYVLHAFRKKIGGSYSMEYLENNAQSLLISAIKQSN